MNFPSEKSSLKVLYKDRAVLLTSSVGKRYLVISDLHIGFEEKFRGAGIAIEPRIDSLMTELTRLIEREKVTDVLIAGDVKSGTDRITSLEWEYVPKFFDQLTNLCRVSVVPGNHDGGLQHLIPPLVTVYDSGGVMISRTLVLHGHTRPLAKFDKCNNLIMGHIHPIFQKRGSPLSGQPVWVFLKSDRRTIFRGALSDDREKLSDQGGDLLEIILMPAFNLELVVAGFAIDTALKERKTAPLLREMKNIGEAMVITLEGDLIGDESLLQNII